MAPSIIFQVVDLFFLASTGGRTDRGFFLSIKQQQQRPFLFFSCCWEDPPAARICFTLDLHLRSQCIKASGTFLDRFNFFNLALAPWPRTRSASARFGALFSPFGFALIGWLLDTFDTWYWYVFLHLLGEIWMHLVNFLRKIRPGWLSFWIEGMKCKVSFQFSDGG